MTEAQRLAYLEAMGVDVWVSRSPGISSGGVFVGPGSGNAFLVCKDPNESATRLAADVARAIGSEPVWGWPDSNGDGADIESAIGQGMFTMVVFFGAALAERLIGPTTPDALGSAAVLVAPGMSELAADADAKRSFWRLISGQTSAGRRENRT